MGQREEECFGARRREEGEKRDWFGLVEFGFFLILIGSIILVTPNFFNRAENFFKEGFEAKEIYQGVFLPAPKGEHPTAYKITMYFCLVFGLIEIVILILRFTMKPPIGKKETHTTRSEAS